MARMGPMISTLARQDPPASITHKRALALSRDVDLACVCCSSADQALRSRAVPQVVSLRLELWLLQCLQLFEAVPDGQWIPSLSFTIKALEDHELVQILAFPFMFPSGAWDRQRSCHELG